MKLWTGSPADSDPLLDWLFGESTDEFDKQVDSRCSVRGLSFDRAAGRELYLLSIPTVSPVRDKAAWDLYEALPSSR